MICETEECEAAGADSTKGRREAQRGMQGWRKGLGWGFLRLPCLTWSLGNSSSVSSITCDKNTSIARHKLSLSLPISACETTVRRSKRDGLGEWGGLLGLWLTGLSWWDRGYQFEGRPATYMSTELKILTSPMSADFGTCGTSGGTARQLRGTVVKYATLLLPRG